MKDMGPPVTPETLLSAYMSGIFPMAESQDDTELFWVEPRWRGVLPLEGFRISRSLAKRMRRGDVESRWNFDFDGVVRACADREETWISDRLGALYRELHAAGFAHSQEIWSEDRMIGGVFGVTLGGAFFGESMFSAEKDGSKMALAVLVHRLRRAGYALFDTQFVTPHLMSLGVQEIPKEVYRRRLAAALELRPGPLAPEPTLQEVMQRKTQMS